LTGENLHRDFIPSDEYREITELSQFDNLLERVYERDPQMAFQRSQYKVAEANVALSRDAAEDQLDVVLSVGGSSLMGDTPLGYYSQEDLAGLARLEYQYDLDKRGFDAQLYQAMLDKQKADETIKKLEHDLEYSVDSLVQQIKYNKLAVSSNQRRLEIENKKLQEALQRYREGRSDTKEIIDFENDLFASSLFYENQKLQLARVYASLNLLLGRIWDTQVIEKAPPGAPGKPQ
jgi:outer membrane protein TolC